MSDVEIFCESAQPVFADVGATTDLTVHLSERLEPENGIAAVVHEAGTLPQFPVWEPVGWLAGGDSLALHPPGREIPPVPADDRTDVTAQVADATQQLVQVLLWHHGLDPTWPPCRDHDGRHPLRPERLSRDDEACWTCPSGGPTAIPVGGLHR